MKARWPILLVVLALLGFSAEVMQRSATHLRPRYDEVAYLALARDYARAGGVAATIRCHLEARCREDNRPPLFQFLLMGVVDDSPASFAKAKLLTFATTLFLFAVVWFALRRSFSAAVATGSVVALALTPGLAEMGSHVLHDPLYSALTFAAVYAIAAWQERGPAWWLLAGALIGLAFLTKGSGHLLLLPLIVVSLYRHRTALARKSIVYAAVCGFVAVSFFLLWRNFKAYGTPLYNVNARLVWLDRWEDFWPMYLGPEWSNVGLGWYLHRHSVVELVIRVIRGAGITIGMSAYEAGIGFAHPALRATTGAAVLLLAALGLRRRWQAGHRVEVLAIVSTIVVCGAALSLASGGGHGPQARYAYPYIALLVPYFVSELLEKVWPPVRGWLSRHGARQYPAEVGILLLSILFVARLAAAAPAAAANPASLYAVDPHWHETSDWLARTLDPGERFALPYQSTYSTWDVPRPDSDPRWNYWFGVPAATLQSTMAGAHVRKVLIDREASEYREYADKLSPASDAHGPLSFLGWPRCFADSAQPSRFLIYCRPLIWEP
jgi:4-amino-4-deoxy-L-arabinose transferase-like glycosyltransferase